MPEDLIKKEPAYKKITKILIKVVITILCFWYISNKIDFNQTIESLKKINWFYLFNALLLLMFSKLLSAYRLNIYFRNIRLNIPSWQNIKLYWLGMFYNLFLPGAISGDAYKVIYLNKKIGAPFKKTSAAVLLDRFSGILSVGILLAISGIIVLPGWWMDMLLATGCILAVAALYLVVKFFMKDFLPGFWPAFTWGMGVQLSQMICLFLILRSLLIETDHATWLFIFLASAVITVLPVSLGGGLGTREFVFVSGASYFNLDQQTGLTISLLFFLITVLASAGGAYFVFNDPFTGRNAQDLEKYQAKKTRDIVK